MTQAVKSEDYTDKTRGKSEHPGIKKKKPLGGRNRESSVRKDFPFD